MPYYITYGELQKHIKEYHENTGDRLRFSDLANYLYKIGALKNSYVPLRISLLLQDLTKEKFEDALNSIALTLDPTSPTSSDSLSNSKDIFVLRRLNYIKKESHMHNYYEINYVAQGDCQFISDSTKKTMHKGEICIVHPFCKHDIVPDDDATVYSIMVQASTFEASFFSLLSDSLLEYFFRTSLKTSPLKHLFFYVANNEFLTNIMQHLLLESNIIDKNNSNASLDWLNLFLLTVLRSYNQSILYYNFEMGTDFALILQYIQHNYQTLTLSSLADLFSYSEPHLSTLIRQNTGYNYTDLIKKLRLSKALHYLMNTDLKIGEIADLIGYNSADHFSRVFRSEYYMSPQQYKKKYKKEEHIPFSSIY